MCERVDHAHVSARIGLSRWLPAKSNESDEPMTVDRSHAPYGATDDSDATDREGGVLKITACI